MLTRENFSESHIQDVRAESKRDPGLLERSIYAFGLLEAIARVGMPFVITAEKRNVYAVPSVGAYEMSGMVTKGAYGMLSKYARPELMEQEDDAFEKAMVERYAKAD